MAWKSPKEIEKPKRLVERRVVELHPYFWGLNGLEGGESNEEDHYQWGRVADHQ